MLGYLGEVVDVHCCGWIGGTVINMVSGIVMLWKGRWGRWVKEMN